MEIFFKIVLSIHIIAGAIGLVTGTLNISRKKGDKLHKNVGKFFFYGMLINGFSGLLMTFIHRNDFLLIISIFSIYMVATGQRYLSLKNLFKGEKPKTMDWILSSFMLLFGIAFIVFGGYYLIKENFFGTVLVIFGLVSIFMVKVDFKNYMGNIKGPNFWLLVHLQRMIGSYIAATTAFLVVNNTYLPSIIAWLLPSVIITPLIFIWSKKYKIVK